MEILINNLIKTLYILNILQEQKCNEMVLTSRISLHYGSIVLNNTLCLECKEFNKTICISYLAKNEYSYNYYKNKNDLNYIEYKKSLLQDVKSNNLNLYIVREPKLSNYLNLTIKPIEELIRYYYLNNNKLLLKADVNKNTICYKELNNKDMDDIYLK